MRRLISYVDQLPSWTFLCGAAALLGLVRGTWAVSRLRANPGAMELSAILFATGVVCLVIFAVRRRQNASWLAGAHVLVALALANVVGVMVFWPFVPRGIPLTLVDVVGAGLVNGAVSSMIGAPLAVLGMWLSRRYGSHSAVTERRLRVVRARRSRVFGARTRTSRGVKREAS